MSISILLFVLIKHYKCIDTWVWLIFSWQINWIFTYVLFIDSLDLQPITELHKIVNELRVKYRTYCMEVDAHYVSMHLYFSSLSTNIVIWLNLFNVFVLFQGYVKRIDGMFFFDKRMTCSSWFLSLILVLGWSYISPVRRTGVWSKDIFDVIDHIAIYQLLHC